MKTNSRIILIYFCEATILPTIHAVVERFPDLHPSDFRLTLSMDNSPQQAGPDSFTARFQATQGRYDGVILQSTDNNMYAALASLAGELQKRLNRWSDRERDRARSRKRELLALAVTDL